MKTTFPQNFVVGERPTTSFPPALHVKDKYACGLKPGFHTIAEIEKFLSLRSLRSRVATIAKIAECMFPYARKDRSDRCDRCDRRDHMETRPKTKQKNSYPSSFSFSDLKLPNHPQKSETTEKVTGRV